MSKIPAQPHCRPARHILSESLSTGIFWLVSIALPLAVAGIAGWTGARFARGGPANAEIASSTPKVAFLHHEIADLIGHPRIGDVDGDGRGDIVVHVHRDDDNIHVPGRKTGFIWYRWPKFEPVQIPVADVCGDRFALVDINGDGAIDFVSGKGDARSKDEKLAISWYQNPGPKGDPANAAAWAEHRIGEFEGWIKDVLAGDINRDGRVEVVVRTHDSTTVFFQTGSGWREKRVSHPYREGLALADLDRDGDLDLVMNGFWLETPADPLQGEFRNHEIDNKWFTQSTGTWQDNACSVGVADFNGDGLLDVVLAHSEKDGYPLSWYSVDRLARVKTGPWKEHRIVERFDWCETVDLGDIDNDGDLDVLAAKFQRHDPPGSRKANTPPFPVSVFFNAAGDGSVWRRQDLSQEGIYAGVLGDIGGDGDLDIVGPRSYWKSPITMWENQSSDRKLALDAWKYIEVDRNRAKYGDPELPLWVRYYGLATVDLTDDGKKDIISGRYFYRNPGGDLSQAWQRVDFGRNVDAILAFDIDGDELSDVIAVALPEVLWLEANDTTGNTWTIRQIGTAPRTMHANSQGFAKGQIVPGGKPEIVLATEEGVFCFEVPIHPTTDVWPRTLIAAETSDEGLDLADIDRDGRLDLIAGKGEEYVAWWKNPGGGKDAWQRHILGTTRPHPTDRVRARDMNGDGKIDIIVTEERYPGKEPDANLFWFEQPADPTAANWPRHRIITEYSLNNLDVADFDRDGDFDIVTCEHKGPDLKLQIFENDGRGRFTERLVDKGKESHLGTYAADLDGDGDLDIISIGWDRFQFLHVWRNDAIVIPPYK